MDLENLEREKVKQQFNKADTKCKLPYKINREIIRLVGERPLVTVHLDKVAVNCLWDTGSMVSVMNDEFLAENFPGKKVHSVDEFLENETLCVSAANNTEVPIEGVTLFDFAIDSDILFLISKRTMHQI